MSANQEINKVNLAETLTSLMYKRNMSMTHLADLIGVYPSTVKIIIDRNRASLPRLIELSKALDYNFFKLYANTLEVAEPADFMVAQLEAKIEELKIEHQKQIESLKAEIDNMKRQMEKKDVEINVLRQVVGLKVG